jgi:aspartyl-tRNA(Asn)/glutamyl-tRNA(Gln) amidotransferase subunit A
MAGKDASDPMSADRVLDRPRSSGLDGLRIGIPTDYFFTAPELDPATKAAVLLAVNRLSSEGATVSEVSIPEAPAAPLAARIISSCEAYAYHLPDLQTQADRYGCHARKSIMLGALFTGPDFVQVQRFRSHLQAACAKALDSVDVLITPTTTGSAPLSATFDPDVLLRAPGFTQLWNLSGLPAISVPCGFSADGMPFGMQIIGRPFEDATVLAVAKLYQRVTDWHTHRPSETTDSATPHSEKR